MSKIIAKVIKKDKADGIYAITARMTVNDLTVRRGADSVHYFVNRFNELMRYVPKKNALTCDQCYKAVLSDDWKSATVIKMRPASNHDPITLWEITAEES